MILLTACNIFLVRDCQAKNAVHRQAVQKANKEGLPVQGQQTTQLLTTAFIEEALILSDLFDLNEYAAVELLLNGKFSL